MCLSAEVVSEVGSNQEPVVALAHVANAVRQVLPRHAISKSATQPDLDHIQPYMAYSCEAKQRHSCLTGCQAALPCPVIYCTGKSAECFASQYYERHPL